MGLNIQSIRQRNHDAHAITPNQLAYALKIKAAFELDDDVQHMTKTQAAQFLNNYSNEYRLSLEECRGADKFSIMATDGCEEVC